MAVSRYYVAPWLTLFAIGGGRFSLTDPGGARQVEGSRVLIHGVWQRDITGHYSETIKPRSARGRAKNTCMSYVEAPDIDPLLLHTLIQADTAIQTVPWTPGSLDDQFGTLSSTVQSQVRSALSNTFFDDQWITATRTFRDIMSYILHVLFGAQQLGADYPDGTLTARWNSLSAQQQTALQAFYAQFGLPAVSGNPTKRELVNLIAQANYVPQPAMGGTVFDAWTP